MYITVGAFAHLLTHAFTHSLTHSLTHGAEALLEKASIVKVLKNFPAVYET
jgi:hypothetical protein